MKFSSFLTIPQAVVMTAALVFVAFMVHDKLAPLEAAGTLAVSLVGSMYLALSNAQTPKDPPPPASPPAGGAA